ncbi:MAG: DUF4424 family protein [Elusimicrobiaceae bacterium]|nr:DUF4424 family protein [Elusimicrobiaceae bacterium]
MKRYILPILSILFLCSGIAEANDTSGTLLPTGEIRFDKQPGIVLKHEALLLSDTVTVDYLFENTTDKSVETTIFFPIPTVGPITAYFEDPHDFQFRVWSNEQEVAPALSRKITLNGTDVTKYFDLMGINSYAKTIRTDPETYGLDLETAAVPLRKLSLAKQQELEKLGMISKGCLQEEEGKCTHDPKVYHLVPAQYHQDVMYYWEQTFPPHQIVHIRHEYKPSFRSNSIASPNSFSSDQIWKQNREYDKKLHGCWKEAAYIITTANNWQTPIGKFNLLIWGGVGAAVSAAPENDIYQAIPASLRLAPKNYLLDTRRNFIPSSEIVFELADKYDEAHNSSFPNNIFPQLYRVDGPARVRSTPNGKKITTLENGDYVWAYPADTKDWFVVLLDEKTTGYTYRTNLISFGKID